MIHLHAVIEDNSISKQIVDILKTFSSVKKIELENEDEFINREKEILDGFKDGLKEIKAIKEGKIDPSNMQDLSSFLKELETNNA